MEKKKYNSLGFIGRFKPLHNGAERLLQEALSQSEKVVIGIGSSNKYNCRNPFTAGESEAMINLSFASKFNNYRIVHVPDFAHIPEYKDGKKWVDFVKENFDVDYFVSGNDYVCELLTGIFPLIHPGEIVPRNDWIRIKGSQVRFEMAIFSDWKKLVPNCVADYIESNGIVDRFRKEFGLETIARLSNINLRRDESLDEEKNHPMEV